MQLAGRALTFASSVSGSYCSAPSWKSLKALAELDPGLSFTTSSPSGCLPQGRCVLEGWGQWILPSTGCHHAGGLCSTWELTGYQAWEPISTTKPEWFKYSQWNILPLTKDNSSCSLWSMTDASWILYTAVLPDTLPSFHCSTWPEPRETHGLSHFPVSCLLLLLLPTSYYCHDILEFHHFALSDRNKTKLESLHHLILGPWEHYLTQQMWGRKFSRQPIQKSHLSAALPNPPTFWLTCLE